MTESLNRLSKTAASFEFDTLLPTHQQSRLPDYGRFFTTHVLYPAFALILFFLPKICEKGKAPVQEETWTGSVPQCPAKMAFISWLTITVFPVRTFRFSIFDCPFVSLLTVLRAMVDIFFCDFGIRSRFGISSTWVSLMSHLDNSSTCIVFLN